MDKPYIPSESSHWAERLPVGPGVHNSMGSVPVQGPQWQPESQPPHPSASPFPHIHNSEIAL
jgi:hypothetical protein